MIYMYIDTKAMIISVCGIMFPKDCIPNMEMNSDYIKNVLNGFFFPTPTPYFFFSNKIYTYCSSSRYINGYVGCMCALSCVKIASNTFHSFIESKKYLVLGSWVSIEPTNLMKLTRLDVLVCWIGLNCNFFLRFELDWVQMNSLSNPYD